jgi:hypothetical protein
MTEQPEPLNLFKKYSYEEMKTALLSWLNPGEAQEETTTAPAAVTTQEAPKPSYTLETKASKASIDDDFAALFGDAPSSEGAPF